MPEHPCAVCGGTVWTALPDPGPRSMASDFRIVDEPLARQVCEACGLARRIPKRNATALFESGYELYAHAPGETRERARQEAYARWIAESVSIAPARVLDVGCGNGSLLLALRDWWPRAELLGCDPSGEAIAHGAAELRLWRGTVDELPADVIADVAVTINVIEHTADPVRFLERVRRRLAPNGIAVVVCPDGSRPGVELLFHDHLFSFAPSHLRAMVTRAGFDAIACSSAPAALGEFQMVIARRAERHTSEDGRSTADQSLRRGLTTERATYLQRWRELDGTLRARMRSPAVCFGAGEAAGLLRAYAPAAWSLVTACTVDGAAGGSFGSLPIVPLDSVTADTTLLLGVRPADQRRLQERLHARFPHVVAWYDLVRLEHD